MEHGSRDGFEQLLNSLAVDKSFDRDFLFEVYETCLHGAKEMGEGDFHLADLGINPITQKWFYPLAKKSSNI